LNRNNTAGLLSQSSDHCGCTCSVLWPNQKREEGREKEGAVYRGNSGKKKDFARIHNMA
jgi:hypothetical protein